MLFRQAQTTPGRTRAPFYPRRLAHPVTRLLTLITLALTCRGVLSAAPTGPTLQMDYGHGQPRENPAARFMYFVPLISPEPISVLTSAGNTQSARVISSACHRSGTTFQATCEFEFGGIGSLRNVVDHTELIRRHQAKLMMGASLQRQLGSISVTGQGRGRVEIEGVITNGLRVVNQVRLNFSDHGKPSPVAITLQDICYRDGAVHFDNELVAQVNTLLFRRTPGQPQMQITVASIKPKAAADSVWQNFMGGLKGMLANQLLPPIDVDATGHQAMLDFGLALANAEPTFTFPFAKRLKTGP
jgi:hypothetical protein